MYCAHLANLTAPHQQLLLPSELKSTDGTDAKFNESNGIKTCHFFFPTSTTCSTFELIKNDFVQVQHF